MTLWTRLRDGLARTRERLTGSLGGLLATRGTIEPAELERLEEALLEADIGPATAETLITRARAALAREPALDLQAALERCAAELLGARRVAFAPGAERPWVALVVGVNGVGKTTLAGK